MILLSREVSATKRNMRFSTECLSAFPLTPFRRPGIDYFAEFLGFLIRGVLTDLMPELFLNLFSENTTTRIHVAFFAAVVSDGFSRSGDRDRCRGDCVG